MCHVWRRLRLLWGALSGLVLLVAGSATATTYTITVTGTSDGLTEQSIGVTEGCTRFVIQELVEAGLRNYRLWAGTSRLEPVDDDGRYGTPTIAQIKANPDVINWRTWDRQFQRSDSYHFSPGCVPSAQSSLHAMMAALPRRVGGSVGLGTACVMAIPMGFWPTWPRPWTWRICPPPRVRP